MSDGLPSTIREFVRDEVLSGVFTTTYVIVDEIERDRARATVVLKSNREVVLEDVPIASSFASDGAGVVPPIKRDDEALLVHPREAISDKISEKGEVVPEVERRFTLESAVLFPMVWTDEDEVPAPYDDTVPEFTISLADGPTLRLLEDDRIRIEQSAGTVLEIAANGDVSLDVDGSITIDATGVELGDPAATSFAAALNKNAVIEYEDTGDTSDGSASTTTKEANISDAGASDVDMS